MAFIPVANTVRVALRYARKGQNIANVFHCEFPTQPSVSDMIDLAAAIKDWWVNDGAANMPTDISLQSIAVRDLTTEAAPGIEYTTGLPAAGGATGQSLPNNVSVVTKLTTGLTGRSFRGRFYWPGLSATQVTSGDQISTTMQTALQTAMNELLQAIISAGFEMVIASLFTAGAPRTAGVTTPVIGASTNLTLDSQRRRLPERGA